MKPPSPLLALPVAAATVALFWIVPEWPLAHLDDPSHWGVLGYGVTLGVLVAERVRGRRGSRLERRWLTLFLVGMPVVYLANWARFGGSLGWLGIEVAGLILYGALALLAARRWPWLLAAGIAAHGLWDLAHYQRTDFVPDWYVVGCFLIDLALGIYAAGLPGPRPPRPGA